ncbi:hypothetical protein BLNAU_13415 [Blattamonas nauphoetae]|uniref:Uncharacterized protein n=1 Tax=Blattamonas nauphoetae TaxID=2049346 RepID=A0ABQ9XI20_9EUKA|nr:hypothetical protein BLNAU_13415 [Blattamonas nauphoetae]
MDTDINNLIDMHKNLPSPLSRGIVLSILINLLLGLALVATLGVVVTVLVNQYKTTNINITLSGMRTSVLALVEFLNLRIVFDYANLTPTDPNITFPRSTNPVFKGFEHLSHNKTFLYTLLDGASNYFQQIHSLTHFGESQYAHTDDDYYDVIHVSRLSTEENEKNLLQESECLAEESEKHNCLVANRIFNVDFPVAGLSSLISQLRFYVWVMEIDNFQTYTDLHPVPRYIGSACRYDLRSGLNQLTNDILAQAQKAVSVSQTVIGIVTIVACIMLFILLFVTGLTWLNLLMTNNEESEKLLELLPVSSDEKEIDLLPSMLTSYPPIDQGRAKIVEAATTVLENLSKHEKMDTLIPNLDYLMITTHQVFSEEEAEMDKRNYEHLEEHSREHLLIRQRLTRIVDEIKQNKIAATRIAKRNLVRLYDKHFIDDDVLFGNTIPAEEKKAMMNDAEYAGEEEHDVGELGEPGQE